MKMSNNNNCTDRESSTPTVRDEDHRLLPLTPPAQIWSNSPISYVMTGTNSDASPTSPGTYYTTIHSTGSRRYGVTASLCAKYTVKYSQMCARGVSLILAVKIITLYFEICA